MPTMVSKTPASTAKIAHTLVKELKRKGGPVVLALSGELGSGKTTFVQGLAKSLGVRGAIQSPTFVLMKIYALAQRARPFERFVHVDAYRINSIRDASRLALPEHFRDPKAVIAIEWARRIEKIIPRRAWQISFQYRARGGRAITIRPPRS